MFDNDSNIIHLEIIFFRHKMKYITQRLPAGYILHEVEYDITKHSSLHWQQLPDGAFKPPLSKFLK